MSDWIEEVINMPDQWLNIAATKALRHIKQGNEKDIGEILVGYDFAIRLYEKTFNNYIKHKDTLSDEDEENLKLAINLARLTIPNNNALYMRFIKQVSFIYPKAENEAK